MPSYSHHDGCDSFDVLRWHEFLKKVAHAVYEYGSRPGPGDGLKQLMWGEPRVESLFVWVAANTPEALGKRLSVAMLTAWADFLATADGIPGRVRPFDLRVRTHLPIAFVPKSGPILVASLVTPALSAFRGA